MKSHLLYFPCRSAIYDWFGDGASPGVPQVSVELLAEQRDFERRPGNGARRVSCHACGHSAAIYVICCRRGKHTVKLYPRKYPGSGRWHQASCHSHSHELLPPTTDEGDRQPAVVVPGGDFAALRRDDLGDPEYRILSMCRRHGSQPRTHTLAGGRGAARLAIGLQRLARELLQRSGLCICRPHYALIRSERDFNGLVKGALTMLAGEEGGVAAALLNSLPGAQFVPWSFLGERDRKTPEAMKACVGFGFVQGMGSVNEHGARLMWLSNNPDCPLVIPRHILEREQRNPRSPLDCHLARPVWVIFVAGQFDGVWKAHGLASFRVSAKGYIPVESHHEEEMVHHLIGEKRAFARWLLPPPELTDTKWVPDFELLDATPSVYVEVAGLMHDTLYAANIARKGKRLGSRLLVWDTRTSLGKFPLPRPPDRSGA